MLVVGIPMKSRIPPCVLPVAAGAGLSSLMLAVADWRTVTSDAAGAIGVAGLVGGSVVGGVIFAINKFDQVKLDRQRKYDEANKDSLSKQLEEMQHQADVANRVQAENQERMRESLHLLRDDATSAQAEAANLRDDLSVLRTQFMAVSKQLHETDLLLHAAREEMHTTSVQFQQTADALAVSEREHAASERERASLRSELDRLQKAQAGQGDRLTKLEQGGSAGDISVLKREDTS